MRFAMIENERRQAAPGLSGTCPGCEKPVIAKCGTERHWHWAHKGLRTCDPWWEPETAWHRRWKAHFPLEWQEVIHHDSGGERHIADVRTEHRVTIEFQHSHLDPEERVSRESFYQNMVWVVDGTRLKRDIPRFTDGRHGLRQLPIRGYYLHHAPEKLFPPLWLQSSVPVLFDFGVHPEDPTAEPGVLWCLLPGRADGQAVIAAFGRDTFIEILRTKAGLLNAAGTIQVVSEYLQQQQALLLEQYRRYAAGRYYVPKRYYRARAPRRGR